MKRSKARGRILSLERDNGSFATRSLEIAAEFLNFYKGILGTKEHTTPIDPDVINLGPILNQQDSDLLIQPVAVEEIKRALLSIGNEKSPGPDGYT